MSFLLSAALLTLLCGCNQESTHYTAIISAMDNEIELLLDKADIRRVEQVGDASYHIGKLHDEPIIITRAGVGKIRAASAATALLDRYPVSRVICTGIAGGVSDKTQVLDEIIATRLLEHDYGILTNDGFTWKSGDPGFGNEEGVYYECDQKLVELAYQASLEVVGEGHAFKGTIATGDQFISSSEYVTMLQENYDAYACEMEGAAIAVICLKYEIPFVVIRALSDKADGNAHDSYANFGNIAADNSGKIVMKMIDGLD